MTRTVAALAALLLLGGWMLSDLTWKQRRQQRELREFVEDRSRYVDVGVVLHTVVADPNGAELIDGKPRVRVLRKRKLGGILDTKSNPPRIIGPSADPVEWFCSEDQEPLILHGDDRKLGLLVYGSEGAGKTVALAMWHYCRWVEHLGEGREGGQTAPTSDRLSLVRDEMFRLYPSAWFTHRVAEDVLTFCDGTRIRLVSTYQQSKAQGSPVQGFSWSWCGRDEAQDQVDRHEDIESRGRAARDGRYKQLATATAKDDTAWRTLRDTLVASGLWERATMLGTRSPFVAPEFWIAKKATMTDREYRRRVEAMDVGPERMLYHTWSRAESLRQIPNNADDVTAQVLAPWGHNHRVLVGHDPGKLWHVSVILKAYRVRGAAQHAWFVVDEVSTRQSTIEQHVVDLMAVLRDKYTTALLDWRGNRSDMASTALVRADPYSDSGAGDALPDRGVYTTFRKAGLVIHPAAYIANASAVKVGRVPKEGRIDMVTRLLCAADSSRRLFVGCDDLRRPVAPKLVGALESMERDVAGRAEFERKDERDQSHWPAALGYALWALERPRLERVA